MRHFFRNSANAPAKAKNYPREFFHDSCEATGPADFAAADTATDDDAGLPAESPDDAGEQVADDPPAPIVASAVRAWRTVHGELAVWLREGDEDTLTTISCVQPDRAKIEAAASQARGAPVSIDAASFAAAVQGIGLPQIAGSDDGGSVSIGSAATAGSEAVAP